MQATWHFDIDRTRTPIGELAIVADGAGKLRAVEWIDHEGHLVEHLRRQYGDGVVLTPRPNPGGLTQAIAAYFAGDLAAIADLPVETRGTAFQRAVWSALRAIPCGTTVSYSELARRIGRPSAVRAVGLANGANPVGVVVPCHRVIGKSGMLVGYGGGLERKRWLLAHEHAQPDQGFELFARDQPTRAWASS
jgi:methylated-DNA-[protein]-cysteine S-methyltransferase